MVPWCGCEFGFKVAGLLWVAPSEFVYFLLILLHQLDPCRVCCAAIIYAVCCCVYTVRQSREPGWLEGVLCGKKGLIPHNYVEFLN